MTARSYYEVLDLSPTATPAEIEAAYARLVAARPPEVLALYSMFDGEPVPQAADGTELEHAYQVLADPSRRAEYDRTQPQAQNYPSLFVPSPDGSSTATLGQVHADPERLREELESPRYVASVPAPAAEPSPLPLPVHEISAAATPPARASGRPTVKEAAHAPIQRLHPRADIELTDETEYSGALLQRLRESADASINQVAEITKINKRYVRAIESHDFDAMPAAVYVRGFVGEYARALGLNPKTVSESYMTLYRRYRRE